MQRGESPFVRTHKTVQGQYTIRCIHVRSRYCFILCWRGDSLRGQCTRCVIEKLLYLCITIHEFKPANFMQHVAAIKFCPRIVTFFAKTGIAHAVTFPRLLSSQATDLNKTRFKVCADTNKTRFKVCANMNKTRFKLCADINKTRFKVCADSTQEILPVRITVYLPSLGISQWVFTLSLNDLIHDSDSS